MLKEMSRIIFAAMVVIGGFLALQIADKLPGKGRTVLWTISILYCLGIMHFTLLSRNTSSENVVNVIPLYTIMRSLRHPINIRRFIQMASEGNWQMIFTTLKPIQTAILNVFLFIPLGYLLPEWNKRTNAQMVLIVSLCVSGLIELIQLLTSLGWCDVDDLICNLCGGMIGFAMYRFSKKRKIRKEAMDTNE